MISQRTVIGRADKVPSNAEQVLDDCVSREESLRLAWRLELAHLSFPLPGRLVRDLRSVVGVLPRIVDDGRHGAPPRRAATSHPRGEPGNVEELSRRC